MDAVELQTIADEIRKDTEIALAAQETAQARLAGGDVAASESCAFHLTRFYNVVEQMGLRVAKAFENSIDDEKGWHTSLIRRLSIPIHGVRPALFPGGIRQPLHELRAFRHVVVHAYELDIDPEKLTLLLKYAATVSEALPDFVDRFITEVAQEQGLDIPRK